MLALSAVQIEGTRAGTMLASVVQFVLLPLGWAAPFATTVLGLLALGQIQQDRHRRRGLSLALFDAILFPLLFLDWLIFLSFGQVAQSLVYNDMISPALADGLIRQFLPTGAVILLDYFLISRAWRAANK